jgi:hypothetical protein
LPSCCEVSPRRSSSLLVSSQVCDASVSLASSETGLCDDSAILLISRQRIERTPQKINLLVRQTLVLIARPTVDTFSDEIRPFPRSKC